MKTFRELKAGDKFYAVNEGTSVGYVRIEEYILEEPLHPSEKVKGTYIAKQKDCNWDLIVHESLLDSTSCGFMFTTLEEACEKYLEKANAIGDKLVKKYNSLINEAKGIYYALQNISKNVKNVADKNYDKIIISKQYD